MNLILLDLLPQYVGLVHEKDLIRVLRNQRKYKRAWLHSVTYQLNVCQKFTRTYRFPQRKAVLETVDAVVFGQTLVEPG